jgi:RHS repeat-associated protein
LVYTNGLLAAKYLYDPFGNTLAQYGLLASINNYRFSSKEWNANDGLYYYLYRFYDPNLQRWPNRDPIQELGGLNLYQYVGNNPINFYDPYGLVQWGMLGRSGVGAVVSGVGAVVGWAAATTGVGTIPGGALGLYSSYQFGANVGNMINTFGNGEAGPAGPAEAVTTLATDNKTAQNSQTWQFRLPFHSERCQNGHVYRQFQLGLWELSLGLYNEFQTTQMLYIQFLICSSMLMQH